MSFNQKSFTQVPTVSQRAADIFQDVISNTAKNSTAGPRPELPSNNPEIGPNFATTSTSSVPTTTTTSTSPVP